VRLYPDVPARRTATLVRDLVVLLLLAAFAWLGLVVHDAVDRVAVLGEGVNTAGSSVQSGFESAADKVEGAPLVGGRIAEGLRSAGGGTGGNVAELGERGERSIHRLADVLGAVVFGLPALLLLLAWLPQRVRQVRSLTAADRALADSRSPERRRLVAMRAAFSLPYGQLLRFTPDPLGDLAEERYDPLVEAALDDAGLRDRRHDRS
jgi:hypothetical protein